MLIHKCTQMEKPQEHGHTVENNVTGKVDQVTFWKWDHSKETINNVWTERQTKT